MAEMQQIEQQQNQQEQEQPRPKKAELGEEEDNVADFLEVCRDAKLEIGAKEDFQAVS